MDLNKLTLSESTITNLYRSVLIESYQKKAESASVPEGEKSYLGGNKKNTLLIVSYPGTAYVPDGELNFLIKLLSACKFTLADVAVINLIDTPSIAFEEFRNNLKPEKVIIFGLTPAQLNLPVLFPQFQVQSFNQVDYLSVPSLSELEPNKDLKSSLWVCLKKLFNL